MIVWPLAKPAAKRGDLLRNIIFLNSRIFPDGVHQIRFRDGRALMSNEKHEGVEGFCSELKRDAFAQKFAPQDVDAKAVELVNDMFILVVHTYRRVSPL